MTFAGSSSAGPWPGVSPIGVVRNHPSGAPPTGDTSGSTVVERRLLPAMAEKLSPVGPGELPGCGEPEEDVYCYFNNDQRACAVRDAHRLSTAGRRIGIAVSRTPEASDVNVGAS